MEHQDMINEMKNMKEKLREFAYILNRMIKELEIENKLNKSAKR